MQHVEEFDTRDAFAAVYNKGDSFWDFCAPNVSKKG